MDNDIKLIDEMRLNAISMFKFAEGYYNFLVNSLLQNSKFGNDVVYGVISICFERLMVSLMSSYNELPISHTPLMLFKYARCIENRLSDDMFSTAKLINSFESICNLDGFGYRTPSNNEIRKMIVGLKPLYKLVSNRINQEI
jgi:hypothetical protein